MLPLLRLSEGRDAEKDERAAMLKDELGVGVAAVEAGDGVEVGEGDVSHAAIFSRLPRF
jgi:hypothetical protein